MGCGSLAEVVFSNLRKFAEVSAEVAEVGSETRRNPCGSLRKSLRRLFAEVSAEVAEVRSQVIEIACGGLRRFCGSLTLPLRGRGRWAAPLTLRGRPGAAA